MLTVVSTCVVSIVDHDEAQSLADIDLVLGARAARRVGVCCGLDL